MPPASNNTNPTNTTAPASIAEVETPEGVGIKIDDVNKSMWQYLRHRKLLELIIFVPAILIWEALMVLLVIKTSSGSTGNNGNGIGHLIALPLVFFAGWIAKIKKQFQQAFLEEFAISNGYSFDKFGTVDETYGTVFRVNSDNSVSDVIQGTYKGFPLRLFIIDVVVGEGKNQQSYEDSVIEIDLKGKLPSLLMVNKHSRLGQLDIAGSYMTKNKFNLEGDFNKHFDLYGLPGSQIEALEVFSPDTMELMEEESSHYTVEFSGNRMYIYANGFIGNAQKLTEAFALAKKLIEKIGPLAQRLAADADIQMPLPIDLVKPRKSGFLSFNTMAKVEKVVMIAAVTILIGLMVFSLWVGRNYLSLYSPVSSYIRPAVKDSTNIEAAQTVSDQFIAYLQQNNTEAALNLEGAHFKNIKDQQGELSNPSGYVPSVKPTIYDRWIGTKVGLPVSAIVYKFDAPYKAPYIKISLENRIGVWQVYGFETFAAPVVAGNHTTN